MSQPKVSVIEVQGTAITVIAKEEALLKMAVKSKEFVEEGAAVYTKG